MAGVSRREIASRVVLTHIYRMSDVEWLGAYGEANGRRGGDQLWTLL